MSIKSDLVWYWCLAKDYKEDDFIYIELKGKDEADCRNKLSRFIRSREFIKIEQIKPV